jgi:glycosyltransferase involved in cell wall biosynthesis
MTLHNSIDKLSVIIPVFNAEKHIETTIHNIVSFLESKNITYEIILVNDNSSDATAKKIELLAQDFLNITIVTNQINIGQDASNLIGFQLATGQLSLIIDDDFEYPIHSISTLIQRQITTNAIVVYGIPINRKGHFLRQIAHVLSHQLLNLLGHKNASNYKLVRKELTLQAKQITDYKNFSMDKFLLTNAKKIELVEIDNIPSNHSRYNLRKLVSKFFNFIFYSK